MLNLMTRYARFTRAAAALSMGATLAACGEDPRLKELAPGIPQDSVTALLGGPSGQAPVSDVTAGADTLANIYRKESFMANGTMYDVLYYHASGKKESRDTVPEKELTPIVFEDGKMTGRGWVYWDSVAKSIKVVTRPRE